MNKKFGLMLAALMGLGLLAACTETATQPTPPPGAATQQLEKPCPGATGGCG